jgi:HEAT repeat protein
MRFCVIIGLSASLLSGVAAQVKEPEYGGKSLSVWLAIESQDQDAREARKTAILHMGTNSLPFLIEAIQARPLDLDAPDWEQQVPAWKTNLIRHWNAASAFADLGHQASPAIPELLRLSREATADHDRRALIDVLGYLREDGLPALMTIAADRSHPERGAAISTIGMIHRELGTNGHAAVPLLLRCLHDRDSNIVSHAAESLGDLALEPETVIPALTNLMQSADAHVRASVLYAFTHWPASGALYAPTLLKALGDPSFDVRQLATNALKSSPSAIRVVGVMGEQGRPAVPILVEALGGWDVGSDAAEALGNLGFDAPVVLPALKRRMRDFRTPVAVASANALGKFGAKARWAAPDVIESLADSRIEVRVAATNALLAIMPDALRAKAATNGPVNTNPGVFRF